MKHINPIIRTLLKNRGITDEDEIREFLSDKPQKTYDPFLLLNLEAGVDLLLAAIEARKKICIYGDYDADGVTSISILMEFIGTMTDQLEYYIPSRFDEGYGLNKNAIQKIKDGGADILLSVDCGSVSYDEVEYAKEIGLQVVVTDHHTITDVKADCILINPKQKECSYPFKELAGCGVAFKLAQGMQKKANLPKQALNRTLDLVAIGTIGDIVPLTGENRTLVKHGMHIVNAGVRPGLRALIDGISLKNGNVKSDHVAFGIVPHINAAGRMEDARIGVELLTGSGEIDSSVAKLVEHNRQRKKIQEESFENCIEIIESKHKQDNFLIVYTEETHEGIAGIVAGKLKDKYHRPTILVTPSGEGFLKGTGRSIETVHLYNTLKRYDSAFERFGGHEGACGFLMKKENLETLSQNLQSYMKQAIENDETLLDQHVEADLSITGREIDLYLAEELEQLAPFGSHNPKPLFMLKEVRLQDQFPMGKSGTHMRCTAVCPDGSRVKCVLFNKAKDYEALLHGELPVTLIGSIDCQEWKGNKKVQFMIDIVL